MMYQSMIVFCFAAYNTFVVLYGIETGLFLEFCRVAIMPLAIGGIILPDSLRSHIVCYRGMSSQGIVGIASTLPSPRIETYAFTATSH